jgi:UDP-N-acetyl-2-amino-2-deoxyglucuronate dehydrogenase
MGDKVQFGVIGCGEIATATLQGLAVASNAEVAMLMDLSPRVLEDLAELYHVPTTTSVEDLFSNPDVDAVYVATPHDTHAKIGIAAAEAGKHVLMEKPITTTLADADALIDACWANDVRLGVGFFAQVDGALSAARDMLRSGLLGEIMAVRFVVDADKPASYWSGGYSGRIKTDWRSQKARAAGGILIMNLSHDINTVRFVTGLEVKRVFAEADTLNTPVEVEDTIAVTLRYDNGAIGSIHACSAAPGGHYGEATGPRIFCTKGQIILPQSGVPKPALIWMENAPEGSRPNKWQELPFAGEAASRREIVEQFADAVLEGVDPPCDGQAGRAALEIVLAAYKSAETHQPVSLPMEA